VKVVDGWHTFFGDRVDVMSWWRWLPRVSFGDGHVDFDALRLRVSFWWKLP